MNVSTKKTYQTDKNEWNVLHHMYIFI